MIHRSVPGPPEPPSLLPNRPPSGPSGRNRAEPEIHPIPLPDRLVLLSAGGSVLAGRPYASSTWVDLPLEDAQGAALGTLRLYGLDNPQAALSALYLERQFKAIVVAALIALACASLVALLTARQLLSPIHRIGEHVARLASGDLSSRLDARRRDELGRMMRDQNALAASLEASRRRERQWVSDTSHELKTPLAILRADIEAMQDGIRPLNGQTLGTMHGAVMRLSRLTDDLRLLASADEARLALAFRHCDLGELARSACEDSRLLDAQPGLALMLDADDPVPVIGDAQRLRQVIDNLLDNSARYTDKPGSIRVSCRCETEVAVLTVSDSGPCPSPDVLPTLFNRFTRDENSRSRNHGGSGLGLSICRTLVTAHRGTIEAHPSDLGGLTFHVRLPLALDHL